MPPQQVFATKSKAELEAAQQKANEKLLGQRARATDVQFAVFVSGMDAVLQQWSALELITQNETSKGGQATSVAYDVREYLFEWFSDLGELYSDEVELWFEDFFAKYTFASIEDGSMKEVADVLCAMYREVCRNDDTSVRKYQGTLPMYQAQSAIARSKFVGVLSGDGRTLPTNLVSFDTTTTNNNNININNSENPLGGKFGCIVDSVDDSEDEDCEMRNDDDDDDGAGEEPAFVQPFAQQPQEPQQQQQQTKSEPKKKKIVRGADGWATVQSTRKKR